MAMTRRGVWSEATDQCLGVVGGVKVEHGRREIGENASESRRKFG
jgi:hypothetical protein